MKSFLVTITTIDGQRHTLPFLAHTSFDAVDAALTTFGVCCKVTAKPA